MRFNANRLLSVDVISFLGYYLNRIELPSEKIIRKVLWGEGRDLTYMAQFQDSPSNEFQGNVFTKEIPVSDDDFEDQKFIYMRLIPRPAMEAQKTLLELGQDLINFSSMKAFKELYAILDLQILEEFKDHLNLDEHVTTVNLLEDLTPDNADSVALVLRELQAQHMHIATMLKEAAMRAQMRSGGGGLDEQGGEIIRF